MVLLCGSMGVAAVDQLNRASCELFYLVKLVFNQNFYQSFANNHCSSKRPDMTLGISASQQICKPDKYRHDVRLPAILIQHDSLDKFWNQMD